MELKDLAVGTGRAGRAYADTAGLGVRVALPLLIVTFGVYVSGLLPARVSMEEMARHWSRPAAEYLAAQGLRGGWSWLGLLNRGDFLNYVPVALLGLVTVAALLRAMAVYVRGGDRLAAAVCAAEVFILLLSVSGILAAGG